MEYGLSFLPDIDNKNYTAADYFKNALKLSAYADQAGLNTIKMTEHYLHPYGGYCPDPLMFLASVAAQTQTIRLMTGCILPVFHHPIQIAAKTAMLDAISNGRLDVGFARAYLPYEFEAFEIDMDNSREKFQDTIIAVKKLWVEDKTTCETPFFNFHNVRSLPAPTQLPHPPLWGAAVNSRQSFAWLGEHGFGLLATPPLSTFDELVNKIDIYRDSFVANEVMKKPRVAISLPLLITEDQNDAVKIGDYYLAEYMRVWADAADSWNNKTSSNYLGYTGMSYALRQNSPHHMRSTTQAIIGTPAYAAEKIKEIQLATSADQILWQIDFGGQPFDSMMQTLQLFVAKVLPLMR